MVGDGGVSVGDVGDVGDVDAKGTLHPSPPETLSEPHRPGGVCFACEGGLL